MIAVSFINSSFILSMFLNFTANGMNTFIKMPVAFFYEKHIEGNTNNNVISFPPFI